VLSGLGGSDGIDYLNVLVVLIGAKRHWEGHLEELPCCQSKRAHLSRRKGVVEKTILTILFIRPFRCDTCDQRFFRVSFKSNPNESRTAIINLNR
jgi:hypothetical protein